MIVLDLKRFILDKKELDFKVITKKMDYRNKTSDSDCTLYPPFCLSAAHDEDVFCNFRRNWVYNKILEHVGIQYENEILEKVVKHIKEKHINEIIKNDKYGNPRRYQYSLIGNEYNISINTIKYYKILLDMVELIDLEAVSSISEIGVGYGGQCRLIEGIYNICEYSLIDIPEVLPLAKRYLERFETNTKNIYINGLSLREPIYSDLIISNYAFSELIRSVQDIYLENVILHAKNGYIIHNNISYSDMDGYSLEELLKMIPNSKVIEEIPLSSPNNCIIFWTTKK